MGLLITSGPATEPVTVSEVKTALRIGGYDEDSHISNVIKRARAWCENLCERAFITQTIRYTIDDFVNQVPREAAVPGLIYLPRPRLIAVTGITYVDSSGTTQTLSSLLYQTDADAEPARIAPIYGGLWPTARNQLAAIRITYTAGYGAASAVPEGIKNGIIALVGHMLENREATANGEPLADFVPYMERLLSEFIVRRYA